MLSSHFFHESEQWTGFRVNLSGDVTRTRAALLRVHGRMIREVTVDTGASLM